MSDHELISLLTCLQLEPQESEWLEFKTNRYEPQELGEYISALSNAACLLGKSHAYLVFGIEDKTHEVTGTTFNALHAKGKGNQPLLLWLSIGLEPRIGFEYHEFMYKGKHIALFDISAVIDQPVKFYGQAFIRVGSSKVALRNYPDKERQIWGKHMDWSAQVCAGATEEDLDPEALLRARREYKKKFSGRSGEVDAWDDITFLNKAKLTIKGEITRAALLLLGRPEASTSLSPAVARASWLLKNERNEELDYEHFDPPLLMAGEKILARIRNLTIRELPGGTLFPVELTQYDTWVIREALHNCIAHQDYHLHGRIQVVETPDALLLTNVGTFLPGSVEEVIRQDAPLEIYRNPFLAAAMVNLNMIDTQGGGIKKMFQKQRSRFFPMPDYDLSQPNRVAVKIAGRILDEQYARLLMQREDLDLETVMLLDRVQKRRPITKEEHRLLKAANLVEGRFPSIMVSGQVAARIGEKAKHIRNKGLDDSYYQNLLLELVKTHQPISREDIDALLMDKLPEVLNEEQKKRKIHNILTILSFRKNLIRNIGSRRVSRWVMVD